ncbi:MAG: hypothetical protein L0228_11720 [Planctomycetes bacterium]|nr:hypothetical protein [Planctomycetota bacterium]
MDTLVGAIEESRLKGEVTDYKDVSVKQWLNGEAPEWPRPWMALVRLASHDWVLAAGPQVDDERISRYGKSRKLQTIVAGHDSTKSKSYFRSYDGGKIQVDYHAEGSPQGPLGKTRLKSSIPVDACLANAKTPEAAVMAHRNKSATLAWTST